MIPIFIASVSPFSGKNLICLGLGLKFKKDGYKVGYLKPVGFSPVVVEDILTDADAVFLSKTLEVNEPLQSICPVVLTDDLLRRLTSGEDLNIREKTMTAFHQASKEKDIMIARGLGRLSGGTCLQFSELDFIKESHAKVIFIDKFQSYIDTLDGFIYASRMLGNQLLGVVFNVVPSSKLSYTREILIPFLKKNGIVTFGVIQLAALETPTTLLILTGELYPNASILGRAQEVGVPIVVVRADTANTREVCENLSGYVSLHDKSKIQRAAEVVEREIDFKTIYQQLELSK